MQPWSRLVAALLLSVAACGGDDDDDDDDTSEVDSGTGAEVDAGAETDASGVCVPTDVLPSNFRPIGAVAEGLLTTEQNGDVTNAIVDGTAGGFNDYPENPFIYIDLEAGAKVDISDVEALTSEDWDIAFKRAVVRLNGGDSGPGGVGVAIVEGTLEDEIKAPAEEGLAQDDWVSDACELIAERDGTPASAFGEWYNYNEKTRILTPKPIVHVIRTRSGSFVKLAIDSYYDESGEETISAVYTVRWAPL